MTDDLITDLSKVSGLFVISRNSTFAYKDSAVKIRQVAEELGVRFVLEGSVRRVGDEVRINVQLIDALTGGHVWAERYDRNLRDIFALQDEVVRPNHGPNRPGRTANFHAQIHHCPYKSAPPPPATSASKIRDAGTCKSVPRS